MDLATERSYSTPFANSTLLPMLLLSLMKQKHTPNTAATISTEYDYVIVGAGSAGSVLASRLSEVPCVTVLLLEAGKPPPYLTEVPALSRAFWFTNIDWAYRTVPQKYTGNGLINRQVVWPSGKTIGGSSVLNGNIYVRGNRRNYDNWAAQGAKGWSYKDVLPYFLKMEDNKDPEYVANGYHGVGGPVTVHRPQYQSEIRAPIFQAAKQMGYRIVDPNGGHQSGFYDVQGTLRNGQRCSSAKAYLVPAENRTNLDILPNAMVRKVLIRKRKARGVQFDFRGSTYEVKAKREVIISAGTTNTAQLLMLSGIGPRKELDRFKIPIKADLPVGKNLQDHIGVDVNFLLSPAIPEIRAKLLNPENIEKYIQNRTGPLASLEFCSANAFLKNLAINPKKDFPNHEVNFLEGTTLNAFLQFGLRPEVYEQVYGPYRGKPFITCVPHLLQPRSRGTVTLQSDNPYDPPMIDPNYLEDPRDVKDIVEGMKVCRRISLSAPLRRLGSVPFATLYPGCEQYAGNEDDYFRCQLRSVVLTFSHYVGTAKMGDPEDPTTVVDPQLRVKYIKGLRVVDASVMPTITSGNTNVPTMMIAEKASDMIKSTVNCYAHNPGKWSWTQHTDLSNSEEADSSISDNPFNSLPQDVNEKLIRDHQDETSEVAWDKNSQLILPWNKELTDNKMVL